MGPFPEWTIAKKHREELQSQRYKSFRAEPEDT